jgi:hypothetical protein
VSAVYHADAGNYAQGSMKVVSGQRIEHPVVLAHPDTGRKGLFLSTGALGLTGVTPSESSAILNFLLAHASSPDYTIRFGWRPGDSVLWTTVPPALRRRRLRRRPTPLPQGHRHPRGLTTRQTGGPLP